MFTKDLIGKEIAIQFKDGHYIDRCKLVSVGPNLAMVEYNREKEGVEIAAVNEVSVKKNSRPGVVYSSDAPTSKTKKIEGKSKKQIAVELISQYPNATRKEMIEMLIDQANMTKAGAGTYYQTIKKQLKQ